MMNKTIVALSTPPFRSALAIVRLSGDDCFFVVSKYFTKDLTKQTSNKIFHGYIKDNDEIVDEVVLLLYKNPHSFTGEDSIEIISHGNPIIYNKIISLAIKNGARMAERGEFSSRAYLNGKLDLIQAESINDLINAETEESKNISMHSLTGKTSELILPIKKMIGDLLSNIEANIDYSEYTDIEDVDSTKIIENCNVIIKNIEFLIKEGKKGKIIKDGINVAIVGKPNVGKSSLLNALLCEEKAIVTDIKGTTRDVVEGKINLGGIILNLFDTAGIRESDDYIEQIGINKSKEILDKADLILAIFDTNNFDDEDKEILDLIEGKNYIKVFNKKDLISDIKENEIYISAKNNEISNLKDKILENLGIKDENFENPSLANERELGLLEKCVLELETTIKLANENITIDILNEHIKNAYLAILEILGEDNNFDVAKEIFSRFCLGK